MSRKIPLSNYDHACWRMLRYCLAVLALTVILANNSINWDWSEHRINLWYAIVLATGMFGGKPAFHKLTRVVEAVRAVLREDGT